MFHIASKEIHLARHAYIAVEGVIGVGKTTLARLLCRDLNAEPLLEVFEENPFLSNFYSDRARYAFQTQIFFLLSRYRQQYNVIPQALERASLISDYTFTKDSLFAHLNLSGDELTVYEKLHSALAEKIPKPDLLVYLRADLDTLMARIAARDRPYERSMERSYIENLRLAYEGFVVAYSECPVLAIDTEDLNIVQDLQALASVRERIRAALQDGTFQQTLPQMAVTLGEREHATLSDLQPLTERIDETHTRDMLDQFLALMQTVGDLSSAVSNADDQETLTDVLYACQDRLARLAHTVGVDL